MGADERLMPGDFPEIERPMQLSPEPYAGTPRLTLAITALIPHSPPILLVDPAGCLGTLRVSPH